MQMKKESTAKALVYKEKNPGEGSCITDVSIQTISKTTFLKLSISEEDFITNRQCASKIIVTQIESSDDDFQLSQDSFDDEWEPSSTNKIKLGLTLLKAEGADLNNMSLTPQTDRRIEVS